MSKYLPSSKLDKVSQWLIDIQTAPILLHPLHSVVQDVFSEAPPNMGELQVPTFDYKQAAKRHPIPKWKSECINTPLRNGLTTYRHQIRTYCDRTNLDQAFRSELNTVESMLSLPSPATNELVTESRSVLKGEFVRVLHIRNSFRAEQQILTTLLSRRGLSPETKRFCETRRGECLYGCEQAQSAAEYIRSYATRLKLTIDFASLLSAFPYPDAMDGEGESLVSGCGLRVSPDSTMDVSMVVSSSGKLAHMHEEAISEVEFKDWKDRWVFQSSNRATRYPGNL